MTFFLPVIRKSTEIKTAISKSYANELLPSSLRTSFQKQTDALNLSAITIFSDCANPLHCSEDPSNVH